jgi:hypothetical protein
MVAIVGDKTKVYHIEYDGYYNMINHDKRENALRRWFDNYNIDKNAYFASDYEWCIVKEVNSTAKRGGKRYICEIGHDKTDVAERSYTMDHTAPEPPLMFFAAKIKYIAPPPPSVEDIRREMEYRRMYDRQMPMPVIDYQSQYLQELILPDPNAKADFKFNLDGSLALPSPGDMLSKIEEQLYRQRLIASAPVYVVDFPSNFYLSPSPRFDSKPSSPPPPPKHRRNV